MTGFKPSTFCFDYKGSSFKQYSLICVRIISLKALPLRTSQVDSRLPPIAVLCFTFWLSLNLKKFEKKHFVWNYDHRQLKQWRWQPEAAVRHNYRCPHYRDRASRCFLSMLSSIIR